jgi:addiction module RelE/StbE family toxin
MQVLYAQKFVHEYKKLLPQMKVLIQEREAVFKANPFDFALRTHKLHGRLRDLWSFSVDFRYRIIFRFAENDTVIFLDVGDHEMYE